MDDVILIRSLGGTWRPTGPGQLRGRHLRHLLTTLLSEAGRPMTVAELVVRCEHEGVVFADRGSKLVSDALRWEIGWGRVVRLRRGVYRFAGMPRSTRYWIAHRVRDLRAYLARARVLPTPTDPVAPAWPRSDIAFVT